MDLTELVSGVSVPESAASTRSGGFMRSDNPAVGMYVFDVADGDEFCEYLVGSISGWSFAVVEKD